VIVVVVEVVDCDEGVVSVDVVGHRRISGDQ